MLPEKEIMTSVKLITLRDVLELRSIYLSPIPGWERYEVIVYRDQQRAGSFEIELTDLTRESDALVKIGGLRSAFLRALRPFLSRGEYAGSLKIVLDDMKRLLSQQESSTAPPQEQIGPLLRVYFDRYPTGSIDPQTLEDSTRLSPDEIARALEYFEKLSVLVPGTSSQSMRNSYLLQQGGPEILGRFLADLASRAGKLVKYFQEVPLPPQYDSPYIFVLMPFSEDEFPQARYRQLLKPVLEENTGIHCLRADTAQYPNRITNQVYTAILRAEAIIAEVSTLNPNVLIEIGIALANEKPLHVLCTEQAREDVLARLFDIRELPVTFYKSEDELRSKLREIRI